MKQKHINEEFPKAAERMNRIYGVHDGPYALGSEVCHGQNIVSISYFNSFFPPCPIKITIADFMVYHAIWEERATKKLEVRETVGMQFIMRKLTFRETIGIPQPQEVRRSFRSSPQLEGLYCQPS